MIPLRLRAEIPPIVDPLVVRLRGAAPESALDPEADATLISVSGEWREYDFRGFSLRLQAPADQSLDGDVLLLVPNQPSAHRLIRAASPHNTLLVTERCDQACVMCSQPPKRHHVDLFPLFEQAVRLAPPGATIGISGGEPTLFKEQLLALLQRTGSARPDIRFHVLTNGQHFTAADECALRGLPRDRILWSVPLYAPRVPDHDGIVEKQGAFDALMPNLARLRRVGATVELRTVVMAPNLALLPELAHAIARDWLFCARWAIMQLEPIGFGRMNWRNLFADTGADFSPVARAINIAAARGIEVQLFNFPRCTVPKDYRRFAPATISDWKQKYLGVCDGCRERMHCGGFFEWYDPAKGFARLGLQ